MAGLFADYRPRDDGEASASPPTDLVIRPMTESDTEIAAAIRAERDGGEVQQHAVWAESMLARRTNAPDEFEVVIAWLGDEPVAYGCIARISPTETAPSNAVPDGLYLGGVVVRSEHRRRGVGRALTAWRLAWIFERADAAFYFASAVNRVSHDLHTEFGFEEVRRGIWAPGVRFTSAEGVLFRATRRS